MLKAYPAVIDDLDLIDEEDQITHTITLEDAVNPENELSMLLEVPVLLCHLHGSSIRVEVEKLFFAQSSPKDYLGAGGEYNARFQNSSSLDYAGIDFARSSSIEVICFHECDICFHYDVGVR